MQVVCGSSEVIASANAISRAFPIYNQKSHKKSDQTVQVGFVLVGEDTTPLNGEDVKCLNALCEGIRLSQAIVDSPCNIMHTDAFLDVSVCTLYMMLTIEYKVQIAVQSANRVLYPLTFAIIVCLSVNNYLL